MKINYYGMDIIFDDTGNIEAVISSIDPYESMFATALCRLGDRALVAGSGLGSISALLVGKLGIDNVISFEPNETTRELSKKYIRANFEPIKIYDAALSDTASPGLITDNGEFSKVTKTEWRPNIWIHNTQYILSSFNINALILDVEGEERYIIPSIDLSKLRVIVVEVHGDITDIKQILENEFALVSISSYGKSTVIGASRDTWNDWSVGTIVKDTFNA